MKSTIVLSILVVLCLTISDAANNAGSAAIVRLKSTIQSTMNDLNRYSNKLSRETSTKLHNLKMDQMKNINDIVNPAVADVRAMISSANGKDAESCFEPTRQRLREASLDGYRELDKCADSGKSSMDSIKSNIEATILLGNRIVNELDGIALNCYSPNGMQMQNCIIAKIVEAGAAVRLYENTASELKKTGDSTSSNAVTTAFACNLKPPQKVREEATSVRIDARKCIDAV